MKVISRGPVQTIHHPFLKGLPAKYQKQLLLNAEQITVAEGERLFEDGGKADKCYLIVKGKVDILTEEQDVRVDPEIHLGILQGLGPGEIVGWSWIIPPYRWRFFAQVKDRARLIVLDGVHIRKSIEKDHEFGYQLYKRLVKVMNQRLIASRMKMAMYGTVPFVEAEGA